MNVINCFTDSLERAGRRAALVSGLGVRRRSLTYKDLDERVDRAVQLLRETGLHPGDRVLLAVPVSIETYVSMLAALKAGLVIMFIEPAHGWQTLNQSLRAYPPAAIIATRAILILGIFCKELRRIPIRITVSNGGGKTVNICDRIQCQSSQRTEKRSQTDAALLTFTSGSTGEPKAIIRSHGFLRNQLDILKPVAELRDDDIDLVAMPMFVLFNLANGITSIIPACNMKRPGRANPKVLLSQLTRERASRMVASPALLERLADYCSRARKQLPQMRRISTGGGPVGPALPDRLWAIAPAARIISVYGSSEAEPIASIDSHEVSVKDLRSMVEGAGLLVGLPVEGCNVQIIPNQAGALPGTYPNEAFDALRLPGQCVGEIIVSGKHVLQGYADTSRDAETKIDVEGTLWHRTGDAGYFDNRGRLWLVGRCSAVIRDNRGEVYPFPVEYAVLADRDIRRAALVCHLGQRVLAIETRRWRNTTAVRQKTRRNAGRDIDNVIAVRRIPMDKRHGAKVDYPALQRLLENRPDRSQVGESMRLRWRRFFRICC